MKKRLIGILLTLGITTNILTGCAEDNKKSYNTTKYDDNKAMTTDIRELPEGKEFDSSFELLSYENVDENLAIYVVRNKNNNKKYMITTYDEIYRGGISVIELEE